MAAVESFLTRPENAKFVQGWRMFWDQLRVYCEFQWKYLCEVQRQKSPWEVNIEVPLSVAHWCQTFKEWHGREMPVIVGATAIFRRDFVRSVAFALPGEGVEAPSTDDVIEQTMGSCIDWQSVMQVALNDITKAKETVGRARPKWGVTVETDPLTILALLEKEFKTRLRGLERLGKPQRTRVALHPLSKSGYILVPADRINKATIEAFTYGAMKHLATDFLELFGPGTIFWRAHAFGNEGRKAKKNYVIGAIGFREEPSKHIQRLLQKNGALAVKAQYALWARAYAETSAAPGIYITLTISQFCDDLGMVRNKGAHRLGNKRAAIEVLEFLTSMELVCIYKPPKGPVQRIRGPIWSRGIISEELRGYEDVFESEVVSAKPLWVPKAFSYAPGPFFENEAWRAYNHFIALVGEGLLKLSSMNADKKEKERATRKRSIASSEEISTENRIAKKHDLS